MPEFVCKLGTTDGQIVERVVTGDNEAALREDLSEQDFLVLSVKRKLALSLPFLGGARRVSANEFLVFNQELRALIQAGMPILGSLDMLIERRKNPVFKQALRDIREDVQGGSSLSEAFQARGDLFPSLYSSSLASGERSGEIGSVLERYIEYARSVAAVRKKILSAAAYPAILITAMIILVAVMVVYVFPSFDELFATMEADIPLATVILLAVSNWFASYYLWVFLFAVAGGVALMVWRRTEGGRRAFDLLQFRIPIIGDVMHKYAVTRFTRTLGTLLAGGIPMVTSLQISSRTVGNSVFSERLDEAARKVREGESLWESLGGDGPSERHGHGNDQGRGVQRRHDGDAG